MSEYSPQGRELSCSHTISRQSELRRVDYNHASERQPRRLPRCPNIGLGLRPVQYADEEHDRLVVEFAIPGAPTDTIDVKILADSVHLLAPAKDIEYVAALALAWPVKPDKAKATYEHGLLRIEVPFKDPMEDAVKVAIKASSAENKTKKIEPKT